MATSSSVDVYELHYTKAEISAAPVDESTFFLLATSLMNDIQILTRQYAISIKQSNGSKIQDDGSSAIAMLNLRLVTGRFFEGWNLIDNKWGDISEKYESRLSQEGKHAVLSIQNYFDKTTTDKVVMMIRNKIAFHSDFNYASKILLELPDETPLVDYMSHQLGDTLYFGCELIHMRALQDITGKTTEIEAFGAVMDAVLKLQRLFLKFISEYVRAFAKRYLLRAYTQIESNRKIIVGLPKMENLIIPFFIQFPNIKS